MSKLFWILIYFSLLFTACSTVKLYESEQLKIIPVTAHSFLHVSYLDLPDYGKVACNGLIYINANEAVIFDTPSEEAASQELMQLVAKKWRKKIKAIVINHFHEDCLGGLKAFHQHGIPSYANQQTLELARINHATIPQHGFTDSLVIDVGDKKIVNYYPGAAHTRDNIVSWIAEDRLLFGGCMAKSIGASKGNTADADLQQWSNTIRKVKAQFPEVAIVVPGHGKYGGPELLDYTIELFEVK